MAAAVVDPGAPQSEDDDGRAATVAVAEVVARAAAAYGRPDLAERVPVIVTRLDRLTVRVPVVGEFKQGKSSIVNALLGVEVCPVDDDEATAVPAELRWGPEIAVEVVHGTTTTHRGGADELDVLFETASTQPAGDTHVIVELDRALLRRGLVVVDTPGVGGLVSRHGAATRAAVGTADAVVFVSSAAQELTSSELEFLREARRRCAEVLVVVSKIDLHPAWRRIVALDVEHLDRVAPDVPVVAVSCVTRRRALDAGAPDVNLESGFPDLVTWLQTRVIDRAVDLARARVAGDLAEVVTQLRMPFEAERAAAAATDAPGAADVVDHLEEARRRRETLRSVAARWHVTLADGITELNAELDHDLRRRARLLVRECEAAIEEHDPADDWPTLQVRFEQRSTEEVAAVFVALQERLERLAARVAEHFEVAAYEATFDQAAPPAPEALGTVADLTFERRHAARLLLTGMRGTYSGMLMFGTLGQLAGLVLSAPATVALGLVLGRNSLRDERRRELGARRAQGKQATRSYLDDLVATAGKEARQVLRAAQRQLRDQFEARAAELIASADAALVAARAAAEDDDAGRARRLADVEAELARLDALSASVTSLLTGHVA